MIALDTGHLVYNYGTKLQAFAMQTLLERSGETVEIVQWHTKDFGAMNRFADWYKMVKKIHDRYGWHILDGLKAYSRYKILDNFNKKFHIHKFYGSFEDMKQNSKIYSKAFCGSDQAWLPVNVARHMYTLDYFGENIFKAAYAPSFGVDSIDEQYRERYVKFLSRLDSISTREISGQHLVHELIGKEVPVVLDPTLLITRPEWDELRAESTMKLDIGERYIFCYFLGTNKAHRDAVKKFACEYGLKIVSLQHFLGYCDADVDFADKNLYKVSPQDFLQLIANAAYVCTDSFHCTVFSIQYHKNFSVFHRYHKKDAASTNSRLYSLLGQIGLEERIKEDGDSVNESNIIYELVDEKLAILRKFSQEYMDRALGGIRNV